MRTQGMFKITPSLRRNFELRVLKKTRVYIAIFHFDVKSRFQSFHKIEISENFENQGRLLLKSELAIFDGFRYTYCG